MQKASCYVLVNTLVGKSTNTHSNIGISYWYTPCITRNNLVRGVQYGAANPGVRMGLSQGEETDSLTAFEICKQSDMTHPRDYHVEKLRGRPKLSKRFGMGRMKEPADLVDAFHEALHSLGPRAQEWEDESSLRAHMLTLKAMDL